jgi:hypothetical protein
VLLPGNENDSQPDHNAAYYLRLEEMPTLHYDTTFWVCNQGAFPDCDDSTKIDDTTGTAWDIMHVDSLLTIWLLNGDPGDEENPTLPSGWGLNVVYQLDSYPDSFLVDALMVPDDAVNRLDLIDPRQYRTVTLIMSPSSDDSRFYDDVRLRSQVLGYYVPEKGAIDSSLVNRSSAVLIPYPNPVVVKEMDEPRVTFKFQVPTDSTSFPIYGRPYSEFDPYLVMDIFTVAGELVATVEEISQRDSRKGLYYAAWPLTNRAGQDVAAGVYLVYARLFSKFKNGELLAEDRAKIAVIR